MSLKRPSRELFQTHQLYTNSGLLEPADGGEDFDGVLVVGGFPPALAELKQDAASRGAHRGTHETISILGLQRIFDTAFVFLHVYKRRKGWYTFSVSPVARSFLRVRCEGGIQRICW